MTERLKWFRKIYRRIDGNMLMKQAQEFKAGKLTDEYMRIVIDKQLDIHDASICNNDVGNNVKENRDVYVFLLLLGMLFGLLLGLICFFVGHVLFKK